MAALAASSASPVSGPVSPDGAWLSAPVLVTGATGLVGSWLVRELLDRGAEVVALVPDRDPRSELVRSGVIDRVDVVTAGLEDVAAVERAISTRGVGTVFHLGAQTLVEVARRSPLLTLEANVRGTYQLLDICRRLPDLVERVVVASSDKAYGARTDLPYVETMPVSAGHNVYDVSKSCTDLIALTYAAAYDLPVAIMRCGNIFGGGDLNWSRVVPGTIRALIAGERPLIRSDGTLQRDYLFVGDAVSAYLALGAAAADPSVRGEAFNVSTGVPRTTLEVVAAITEVMGLDVEPVIENRAVGEIPAQWLSSEKAARVLGWKPGRDLEADLSETVEWYRALLV